MIVRLKVLPGIVLAFANSKFQFYDSPIKRKTLSQISNRILAFQFYDSPIKRLLQFMYEHPILFGFNSMIVRLKGIYFCGNAGDFLFQFYDSPIKSVLSNET